MSATISWIQAKPLMDSYKQRTDAVKVHLPDGDKVLKGLRFEKAHIEALLSKPGITHLFLMFANSAQDANNITLVAGGVADSSDNGGVLDTGLLYDYAEACPSKCPSNI
jgi:replicative DNA helicase